MKGFDFEEERIKQEITRLNAKRVLLQMPEGLKPEAPRLAKLVEKAGACQSYLQTHATELATWLLRKQKPWTLT